MNQTIKHYIDTIYALSEAVSYMSELLASQHDGEPQQQHVFSQGVVVDISHIIENLRSGDATKRPPVSTVPTEEEPYYIRARTAAAYLARAISEAGHAKEGTPINDCMQKLYETLFLDTRLGEHAEFVSKGMLDALARSAELSRELEELKKLQAAAPTIDASLKAKEETIARLDNELAHMRKMYNDAQNTADVRNVELEDARRLAGELSKQKNQAIADYGVLADRARALLTAIINVVPSVPVIDLRDNDEFKALDEILKRPAIAASIEADLKQLRDKFKVICDILERIGAPVGYRGLSKAISDIRDCIKS